MSKSLAMIGLLDRDYKWLDKATQARDDYLADLISAEEALSIIKVS